MVRVNPIWEEPINESIVGYFAGMVNKITKKSDKHNDQIIIEELDNYYNRKKILENPFSNEEIECIRKNFIHPMIQINQEEIETLSKPVIEKLIVFFENFFIIDNFQKYQDIFISDDEYIKKTFKHALAFFDTLNKDSEFKIKIENYFEQTFAIEEWKEIHGVWNDFKEEQISSLDLLKSILTIVNENNFYRIMRTFFRNEGIHIKYSQ